MDLNDFLKTYKDHGFSFHSHLHFVHEGWYILHRSTEVFCLIVKNEDEYLDMLLASQKLKSLSKRKLVSRFIVMTTNLTISSEYRFRKY